MNMLKPKTCADLADKQAISLLLVKEDAQVEPPEEEPQTSVAGDVGIYMEVWLTASGWSRDWHECDLRAIAWCRISSSDSIHVSQLRMTWHIPAATSKTRMMSNSTTVTLVCCDCVGQRRMQFQYNVLHHH